MGLFNKQNKYNYRPLNLERSLLKKQDITYASNKSRNKWVKFFLIVCSTVGIFLLVASIATFGYVNKTIDTANSIKQNQTTQATPLENKDDSSLFLPPKKTNFLIMGLDKTEALTDVIMVGSFDRDTKQVDLISVPRDTYIKLSEEDISFLQDNGRHPPSGGVMKMNAVHSYAGNELGAEFLHKQIEKFLGINIAYYAEVNLEVFREIVDAVGGVDMVIPEGGLYYSDPLQNLKISVAKGPQKLNGEQAEGVVRYRATYRRGDLQRIEMQQEFLKAFFKKVTDIETLQNNAINIAQTLLKNINTNFPISRVPKYARYINDLDPDKFFVHTLPGQPQTINGASYYLHDPVKTRALIDNVFYSENLPVEETASPNTTISTNAPVSTNTTVSANAIISSPKSMSVPTPTPVHINKTDLKVQVLNGGNTAGLAATMKKELTEDGYNVVEIGNYSGARTNITRIIVKDQAMGKMFEQYFLNSKIEIDKKLPPQYDVRIVLGLNEK